MALRGVKQYLKTPKYVQTRVPSVHSTRQLRKVCSGHCFENIIVHNFAYAHSGMTGWLTVLNGRLCCCGKISGGCCAGQKCNRVMATAHQFAMNFPHLLELRLIVLVRYVLRVTTHSSQKSRRPSKTIY